MQAIWVWESCTDQVLLIPPLSTCARMAHRAVPDATRRTPQMREAGHIPLLRLDAGDQIRGIQAMGIADAQGSGQSLHLLVDHGSSFTWVRRTTVGRGAYTQPASSHVGGWVSAAFGIARFRMHDQFSLSLSWPVASMGVDFCEKPLWTMSSANRKTLPPSNGG